MIDLSSNPSLSPKTLRIWTYPEQQLPGVPHELGVPQQPPEPGSGNLWDEPMDVL